MTATQPAIARSFSRAARSYDSYAEVQLSVARSLLAMLPQDASAAHALDLGCGTASMARSLCARLPLCHWLGVDVSVDMLAEADARGRLHGRYRPLCADASRLPLANASQDVVFSSFALQWVMSADQALAEVSRVLRPGGTLLMALPVAGTLTELRQSWAEVDDDVHVNPLLPSPLWLQALVSAGLYSEEAQTLTITEHYPSVAAIGRMLKMTGAHHVPERRTQGLMSPKKRRALERSYEMKRDHKGLPLTWQVLFVMAKKTDR